MSESTDGKVDYKESYFKCFEENEVLGKSCLKFAKDLHEAIEHIEKLTDLAIWMTGLLSFSRLAEGCLICPVRNGKSWLHNHGDLPVLPAGLYL